MTESTKGSDQPGNGLTALKREADRVEHLRSFGKSDSGEPASGTAEQGGSPQAEQDRRIARSRRAAEAQDDGAEAFDESLNQDG